MPIFIVSKKKLKKRLSEIGLKWKLIFFGSLADQDSVFRGFTSVDIMVPE